MPRASEMLARLQQGIAAFHDADIAVPADAKVFLDVFAQMVRIEAAVQALADAAGMGPGERIKAILEGRKT